MEEPHVLEVLAPREVGHLVRVRVRARARARARVRVRIWARVRVRNNPTPNPNPNPSRHAKLVTELTSEASRRRAARGSTEAIAGRKSSADRLSVHSATTPSTWRVGDSQVKVQRHTHAAQDDDRAAGTAPDLGLGLGPYLPRVTLTLPRA